MERLSPMYPVPSRLIVGNAQDQQDKGENEVDPRECDNGVKKLTNAWRTNAPKEVGPSTLLGGERLDVIAGRINLQRKRMLRPETWPR